VTEAEIKLLIKRIDPYNTSYCEFNNFLSCVHQVSHKDASEFMVKNTFSAFDKEDRGYVSVDELKHVLSRFGEPLNENEVNSFSTRLMPSSLTSRSFLTTRFTYRIS